MFAVFCRDVELLKSLALEHRLACSGVVAAALERESLAYSVLGSAAVSDRQNQLLPARQGTGTGTGTERYGQREQQRG